MVKHIIAIIISIITFFQLQAQKSISGHEFIDLVKISDRYENIPNLSFKILYAYTDSINEKQILDSTSASYYISNGKTLVTNNKFTWLQNEHYTVTIDNEDSLMYVGNASHRSVLQLPFMDSVFRAAHVAGMSSKDINDTLRMLTIDFNPGSFYHKYQIIYRSDIHLLKEIKYYTNSNGMYGLDPNAVLCTSVVMDNYSTSGTDASNFNESKYVYQLNNKWFLQPLYEKYKLQLLQ